MKKFQSFLVMFLSWSLISNISAQACWKILSSKNGQITSYTPYNLQAIKGGAILTYQQRKYGINLSWGAANVQSSNFQFVKEGGGAINCGDKIALFNDNGGYIKYEKRDWGINLVPRPLNAKRIK